MEPNEVLDATEEPPKDRLNAIVALTIAILATFMGICKVKDDNICQAMQQAQADKIDNWGWYQAKKTRDEMMQEHLLNLALQSATLTGVAKITAEGELKRVRTELSKKRDELKDTQSKAEQNQKDYDALNYRDDQFDLSDSALAIAISMLAVAALTHKRFLFYIALVPIAIGILMGLAGLFGWHIHPDAVSSWLGA